MPTNIELIIFDLDGTLVNSIYDITDSLNCVLTTFNYKPIDYVSAQQLVGGGTLKLVQKAFGDKANDADFIEKAHGLFTENYLHNLTNKTLPYEGVLNVLQHFKHKKKAVLSNKPHALTVKIIKELHLDRYFAMVLGSNEALYSSKPSGEGILHILSELKTQPKNALMVGDSVHDIQAGKNAGIATCAVTYGYRTKEVLLCETPDYTIDHVQELAHLLK